MKMINEDQLLNEDFRKLVIDEIEDTENQGRKAEMKKRYDVFKDETEKYVLESFRMESKDEQVVKEIINRLSNISFCRKIIEKKAQVYKDGVRREMLDGSEESQQQLDSIVDFTNLNSKMKKANKYAELFKNAAVTVIPYKDPAEDKYSYNVRVLQPYLYDVIEDQDNPEVARAYIFSYYTPSSSRPNSAAPNQAGMREGGELVQRMNFSSDGKDQIIADSPDDFGVDNKEYVFWSNKYHFTTDKKGKIIPGRQEDDLANPIGMLPFYNFSQDQDGQFWAKGGADVVTTSIKLNIELTDMAYLAKFQGHGIGYMFGKGVPKNIKVGPSSFISLEVEEGDPRPEIGFATSNPPIDSWLAAIDKELSLLLDTNNLKTSGGNLTGDVSSGIHEMIMNSENMNDIEDQRELYRDGEPYIYKVIARWHNLYFERGLLIEDLQEIGKLNDMSKLRIKFQDAQPFMTEKEKLEVIEKRLMLGLDSMLDAIKKDNPDLSEEEAMEKLNIVQSEKMEESKEKMKMFANSPSDIEDDKEEENGESQS